MEKSKKFEDVFNTSHPPRFIRKEALFNANKRKVVAFVVSDLDWSINRGEGFDEKSEIILEKEGSNFDEEIVLYEWQSDNFYKIEDIKSQSWFKI